MSADIAAFCRRFGWPDLTAPAPVTIAHRGARAHVSDNTLAAFRLAHDLGAEMWELDLRVSRDGAPVVCHDAEAGGLTISETPWNELAALHQEDGARLLRFEEVVALAGELGAGLYIELKDVRAGRAAWQVLKEAGHRFAAIGAFVPDWIGELRAAGCDWPLAVLVPAGADPLAHAAPARPDIVHPCWHAAAERPDALLTDDLVGAVRAQGMQIVTWHEDRPEVIAALQEKPLLGICADHPERQKPARRRQGIEIVCHRGLNMLAPENTLQAVALVFDQGFDFAEIDVRTTADGALVVCHDATLDRTTDGTGRVRDHDLASLRRLDAGGWFAARHRGVQLPTLREVLAEARGRGGVYVEIKDADPGAVLAEVDAAEMRPHCFFWSSDTDALRWLRRQGADIRLMAPRWLYASVVEAVADYAADIVEFDVTRDDLDEAEGCRALGVRAMIYSQSHDPGDLEDILRRQPDMVNLDAPVRFKHLAYYPARGRLRDSAARADATKTEHGGAHPPFGAV